MSDYWLGVLTLPTIALVAFVVRFLSIAVWQELIQRPTDSYTCRCGKGWGHSYSNHRLVQVRYFARFHRKRCRTNIMYREWYRESLDVRKTGKPYPKKSAELERLLTEGEAYREVRDENLKLWKW